FTATRCTTSKSVGTRRPMTDSSIIVELVPAIPRSKRCVPFLRPPTRSEKPRMRSRFPRIDPTIEAFTRSSFPAFSATTVMISSAAFPSVAFRSPPAFGPVRSASSSVASPRRPASGTRPMPAQTNVRTSFESAHLAASASGTNTRSQRSTRNRARAYVSASYTPAIMTEKFADEERLRLLAHTVESSFEMITVTDLEDRFTFVNRAFLEAYGYMESEILGRHISLIDSPKNPARVRDSIWRDTRTGGFRGEPLLCPREIFEVWVKKGEVELVGAPSVDWLGVPLQSGGRTFGVLVVQSYDETVRFDEKDKEILTFVARHISAVIEKKRSEEA